MKRILPILLLAAAIAAGVWFYQKGRNGASENEIRVSGNIEMTQVAVAFKAPGRIVALEAEEGTVVKKGQLLARIDREIANQQRIRDVAGITAAQAQFDQLQTAIAWQKQAVEREVELRNAELRAVEAQLREATTGARPQEIQQSEAALSDARTQLAQAKLDWDRAQKLFADEDITRAQYDQFKTRFDSATALVKQAEMRTSIVKEGPRKETLDLIRAQQARAQAALKAAENNRLEVRRREQEAQSRKAEIDRAKAQVHIVDVQIADTTAEAPVDGVILTRNVDLGEIVNVGTPVMTIGDIRRPWLRAYVTEKQLGRVKLGDKVSVTSDSYPGKTYPGRVSFIASEAEFTPKQIQTAEERIKLVYRIKVELENPSQELKLNMPVDAVIGI